MRTFLWPQVVVVLVIGGAASAADFERDVRPILTKNCIRCHGPEKQESGLRVDSVARLLQGGDRGPAIVPGKSGESLLIRALSGTDELERMPAESDPLSVDRIAVLKQWIDEGAKPPAGEVIASRVNSDHWSFRPVVRPPLPTVSEPSWCRAPIDRFIRARLERESLSPSDEATRATLIRRLFFDLVGLPPRPDDVDAFLGDSNPDAYDRVVDRLLASPHHGERWGRHWLDQARYADSHGFTIDGPRSIWKYRDWVIAAINRDLPFDQFTIEQIAGDLLPSATTDQIIATGFHRNTLINQEGGTDPEQFRVEAVVDRVNTTGAVFLGLTIGCAQCHSHKYDPVSQREYYELFAFFNQCDEPNILAPTPVQAMQLSRLKSELAAVEVQLRDNAATAASHSSNAGWTLLDPTEFRSAGGAMFVRLDDQSLLVTGDSPATDTYTIAAETSLRGITAVRIEALTHDSLPKRGPGLSETGNFVLNSFKLAAAPRSGGEPRDVAIGQAFADEAAKNRPLALALDNDPKSSWTVTVKPGEPNRDHAATFVFAEPIGGDGGTRLVFTCEHNDLVVRSAFGRVQFWATAAPREAVIAEDEVRGILAIPAEKRNRSQQEQLSKHLASIDPKLAKLVAQRDDLKRRERELVGQISTTMVMRQCREPRATHVHLRGDFLRKGARVQPGVPGVFPAIAIDPQKRDRLTLARWLVGADNPLTPRVTVNRLWQRYFGAGLVETENDFGIQGSLPSHGELLDWLARELVARSWSQKEMHRLVVTSAAYRQSSKIRQDADRIDPRNRLLWRQARLRLDAEVIRDAALAASGLLARKIGGPSVFPPQPQGVYRFTQQDKQWRESQGEDRYRRGLYTFFFRSSPHPMLTTFDAPGGNATCTRRLPSNTPLQALTMANDRGLLEIADGLATTLTREGSADEGARIEMAFRLCLSRSPLPQEAARLSEFVDEQRRSAQSGHDDRAVWSSVARVLFNLDEFITRE
jgi:hypothetical protein